MKKIKLWKNDRTFDYIDENQGSYHVVEHNDLITKARYDLSTNELKIMDFIISKIKPDDDDFNIIQISMYELTQVLDIKRSGGAYNRLANNLNNLRKADVFVYNEREGSVTMTGWLESAKVWESGQIEVQINKDFAPYLLNLIGTGNYTQYLLEDTVQLSSKYSIRLYKLMREADKHRGKRTPVLSASTKELGDMLNVPKSYDTYGKINKEVLKPTVEEINLKIDDMDLTVSTEKSGRKVVAVDIVNNYYPIKKGSTQNDIPMINWLKDLNK